MRITVRNTSFDSVVDYIRDKSGRFDCEVNWQHPQEMHGEIELDDRVYGISLVEFSQEKGEHGAKEEFRSGGRVDLVEDV